MNRPSEKEAPQIKPGRMEFLERCANAYDMGLITYQRLHLMEGWLDVVMREGHSRLCDHRSITGPNVQDQWDKVRNFWYRWGELTRLDRNTRNTFGDSGSMATLANDSDGYAIIRFAAILRHPCQQCAVDPEAWHTRSGFCQHRDTDGSQCDS